jgi:low molecular weight phosphotyrosine protein phosphatase
MAVLRKNGITTYQHAARKFSPTPDFATFDYIFAMDDDNLDDLLRLREREVRKRGSEKGVGRVMLFGEFGRNTRKGRGEEIADPYYGGDEGFETAFEQAGRFSRAFLNALDSGEVS